MTTILGLNIVERIKVKVMNDACIGCGQINPHASSPSAQEKDWNERIIVEFVNHLLSFANVGTPIQTKKR
jgi:hypothetical protein